MREALDKGQGGQVLLHPRKHSFSASCVPGSALGARTLI